MTRSILILLLLPMACGPSASVSGRQGPPPTVFQVEHDHAVGAGAGELRFTETGVEFHGTGDREARHDLILNDADIKRLTVSPTEIKLTLYGAGRIPVLPRGVFVRETKSVPFGRERVVAFRLARGEFSAEFVESLRSRFVGPMTVEGFPLEIGDGQPRLEIPVFHRHRIGGESGVLRMGEGLLVFQAENVKASRTWRPSDVRDIARLGRFKLELAAHESAFGTDGKSYVFDLKRPMTEAEFETLWKFVYAGAR